MSPSHIVLTFISQWVILYLQFIPELHSPLLRQECCTFYWHNSAEPRWHAPLSLSTRIDWENILLEIICQFQLHHNSIVLTTLIIISLSARFMSASNLFNMCTKSHKYSNRVKDDIILTVSCSMRNPLLHSSHSLMQWGGESMDKSSWKLIFWCCGGLACAVFAFHIYFDNPTVKLKLLKTLLSHILLIPLKCKYEVKKRRIASEVSVVVEKLRYDCCCWERELVTNFLMPQSCSHHSREVMKTRTRKTRH